MTDPAVSVIHLYQQRHAVLCGTSRSGDTETHTPEYVTCPQCNRDLADRRAEGSTASGATDNNARTPLEILNAREMLAKIHELATVPAQRSPAVESALLRQRAVRIARIVADLEGHLDELRMLAFNGALDGDYYLLEPR